MLEKFLSSFYVEVLLYRRDEETFRAALRVQLVLSSLALFESEK